MERPGDPPAPPPTPPDASPPESRDGASPPASPPAGAAPAAAAEPPVTPDGRYIAVRGRLWRRADPSLPPELRAALHGTGVLAEARARVDAAKRGLGERGDVWWSDGAPDLTRHMARLTPYADWFAALPDAAAAYGARGPGRRRAGAAPPAPDGAPDA